MRFHTRYPTLDYSGSQTFAATVPTLPFIVPSVLEKLSHHELYGPITHLVPAEADTYCAAATRTQSSENSTIILTNDSDLVLHSIGDDNGVVFLKDIQQRQCGDCGKDSLTAKTFMPSDIMSRLGLSVRNEWLRVGYELSQDLHVTLATAAARVRKWNEVQDKDHYELFLGEYSAEVDEPELEAVGKEVLKSRMDPRLSEFILQLSQLSQHEQLQSHTDGDGTSIRTINVFPRFLNDDPTRTPAWTASNSLRSLSYSLAVHFVLPPGSTSLIAVHEYVRRGPHIADTSVQLLSLTQCAEEIRAIVDRIQPLKNLPIVSENLTITPEISRLRFWQVAGVAELLEWHRSEGRAVPSQRTLAKALGGHTGKSTWGWEEVRVRAMLEAVLYGLRMLVLTVSSLQVCKVEEGEASTALSRFTGLFHLLPELDQLLGPIDHAQDIVSAAQSLTGSDNLHPHDQEKVKSKSQQKDQKRQGKGSKLTAEDPQNMYSILAEHE